MKTSTQSTHELCNLVKPYFKELKQLSYNRHQPDKSVWWLCPTAENPSYKYTKLCFMPDERNENTLLSGLYVEKGLGKSYCEVYGAAKTKKLAIDNSWGWHRIITEMKLDTMPKALELIANAIGENPLIMLSGQFSTVGFDPDAHRLKAESIYFEASGNAIREIDYRPSPDKNPLSGLRTAATLIELADRLENLPQSDFIWIDMAIIVPLVFDANADSSAAAETISKKVLAHFESWITE